MDIFERIKKERGPIGKHQSILEGDFAFPKFTGKISNRVSFKEKVLINWSYNNYLGLANSEEVRNIDSYASSRWGITYPMGSRMMTGDTYLHDTFENNMASFLKMENALVLNFGYQGMFSIIDCLLKSTDVVISDEQCHACTIDGIRLHKGSRLVFKHNNIESLEEKIKEAKQIISKTKGGILVVTEGVFSMSGTKGKLKEICALKKIYNFRLLVDDAHGFGVAGLEGNGSVCEANLENEVDLYFTTFTKSMASFGAIIAGKKEIINYFKYNLRSQIFSKSLPMSIVYGLNERLKIIMKSNDKREKLFKITNLLQNGLKEKGFLSHTLNTCITPIYFNIELNHVLKLQRELVYDFGIYCSVIIYPVVPKDVVIFRLTSTSLHSNKDVTHTLQSFDKVFKKYIK
ncbi:aminotransferase class I/II-fold pyridoxal phosphate-dependent enzyme [uncultured Tenacibaculum sp.]|uniref:aminotransferase class I/II-fold pyridoxal phosphate-dependent enzyme n=1 Tax=uncultured Tenacibaculum sp. TaxID=174713 RepID=UPI00261879B5|nr:aminotransferase class I/II-fold pyridoxal phosphate-dependent enzyme [uncultured Tenacibaculum sp.]